MRRTTRAIERRGEEGARREIDLTSVFVASAKRRMAENVAAFDENDDELRKAAPPAPNRVLPNAFMREECYEKAFQAAVKLSWKDADQAWRSWFRSR